MGLEDTFATRVTLTLLYSQASLETYKRAPWVVLGLQVVQRTQVYTLHQYRDFYQICNRTTEHLRVPQDTSVMRYREPLRHFFLGAYPLPETFTWPKIPVQSSGSITATATVENSLLHPLSSLRFAARVEVKSEHE